jgi:hypothetical protein
MKIVIIILLSMFLIGFSNQYKSVEPIYLIPSKDGFEIYDSQKELVLEFTHTNTDSPSLETLTLIHEVLSERTVISKNKEFLLIALKKNDSLIHQNSCEQWK